MNQWQKYVPFLLYFKVKQQNDFFTVAATYVLSTCTRFGIWLCHICCLSNKLLSAHAATSGLWHEWVCQFTCTCVYSCCFQKMSTKRVSCFCTNYVAISHLLLVSNSLFFSFFLHLMSYAWISLTKVQNSIARHKHDRVTTEIKNQQKDHIFLAEGPTFLLNWTCYQRPPVLTDHFYGQW